MDQDKPTLEQIAAAIHDGWMAWKKTKGVMYGPERTDKTHPHMIAFEKLDESSKNQDRFIASVLLRDWGRNVIALSDLPAAIHNTWVEWEKINGNEHPHAKPYSEAHGNDPGEHKFQAELVAPLLKRLRDQSSSILDVDKQSRCVVMMPYRQRFQQLYSDVLVPAIRHAGHLPIKADDMRGAQSIDDDVLTLIESSNIVIADISENNPNVNYEIGLSRSLGRPIVMICEESSRPRVPFYYKKNRIHYYDATEVGWQDKLRGDMDQALARPTRLDPLSENQVIGLTGLYKSDDSVFYNAFSRDLLKAEEKIVALGWGIAVLNSQRRDIVDKIRRQILDQPKLVTHILMPRKDHPGLIARIEEENNAQPGVGIITDWPTNFFKFAQELPNSLVPPDRQRVIVKRIPYMPTAMVIQLDNTYYFRCYGPPNKGGWASPWLRCEAGLAGEDWVIFLKNLVNDAILNAVAEPQVLSDDQKV